MPDSGFMQAVGKLVSSLRRNGKVIVYRYQVWDSEGENWRLARRWGTRDAIEATMVGQIIEDMAVEVEGSVLNDNGMTELDYNPYNQINAAGFQKVVR